MAPTVPTARPLVAYALIAVNVLVAIGCVLADSEWLNGDLGRAGTRGALVGGARLMGSKRLVWRTASGTGSDRVHSCTAGRCTSRST